MRARAVRLFQAAAKRKKVAKETTKHLWMRWMPQIETARPELEKQVVLAITKLADPVQAAAKLVDQVQAAAELEAPVQAAVDLTVLDQAATGLAVLVQVAVAPVDPVQVAVAPVAGGHDDDRWIIAPPGANW